MDIRTEAGIELHIEELVLDGFAQRDRYEISQALEQELTRLFAEQGVPGSLRGGGDLERVDVGAFNPVAGANGQAIGVQLAQAMYRGFTR